MKNQDRIFQNYGKFIFENKNLFTNKNYLSFLQNDEAYNNFTSGILEGFSEDDIKLIRPILQI